MLWLSSRNSIESRHFIMHKSRSSFATHLPLKSHAIKNVNEQINPPFIALFEILYSIQRMKIIVLLNGLSVSIKNKLSRTYAVTALFWPSSLFPVWKRKPKYMTKNIFFSFCLLMVKWKKKRILQTNVIQFSVYFTFNQTRTYL